MAFDALYRNKLTTKYLFIQTVVCTKENVKWQQIILVQYTPYEKGVLMGQQYWQFLMLKEDDKR